MKQPTEGRGPVARYAPLVDREKKETMHSLQDINSIIGRTVLSLGTANELGRIHDFVIDPLSGQMAGLAVQRPDEGVAKVDCREIHSIGPDAVMLREDESLTHDEDSPLTRLPLAKG